MLEPVLRVLDRTLQLLIPAAARRVCYRSHPDYTDNAYYVYRHALRTRHDLEHVWLVRDRGLADRIRREFEALTHAAGTRGHRLRIVNRRSVAGYWLYLRSRSVFHTHGTYPFSKFAPRRAIVCLWHGMPIKRVGRLNRDTPNPFPTFGTVHVATSRFFRDIVASAFAVPPERVRVTGLPRCDALRADADRSAAQAEVRHALGLSADRRLVLWLPTYRSDRQRGLVRFAGRRSFLDDLPTGMLESLDRACAAHGCCIVVKLHPFDVLNDAPMPTQFSNLRWLRSEDWLQSGIQLYDLVAASDGLLSDVSSILVDYLVTGRLIGIVGFDPSTYTRGLTVPADYLTRSHRFTLLRGPTDVDALFARIAAGAPVETSADDVASMFNDDLREPASEALLREVGI